jgi:hypothetical protein
MRRSAKPFGLFGPGTISRAAIPATKQIIRIHNSTPIIVVPCSNELLLTLT